MDVLRKAATNGSLLLRTRPVVLFAILAVAPVLVCFRFRVLLPWIRSWYSRSNDSLPCLARAALARPPRAMTTPFTDPRGVMNLRPLCEDVGGMLFDVDNLYLTMVELKRTFLNTPTLRGNVFGIHEPIAQNAHEASAEALEMIVARVHADYPGLVERRGELLVNIATGRFWRVGLDFACADCDHPLSIAAQLVQEDLAVMLPMDDEGYVLGGAASLRSCMLVKGVRNAWLMQLRPSASLTSGASKRSSARISHASTFQQPTIRGSRRRCSSSSRA